MDLVVEDRSGFEVQLATQMLIMGAIYTINVVPKTKVLRLYDFQTSILRTVVPCAVPEVIGAPCL